MERAALSLLVSTLSPIINKLGEVVYSPYFGGDITPDEIQKLVQVIIPTIQTVIQQAEKIEAATLEPWLKRLNVAAYEAEDVLDMLKYQEKESAASPLPIYVKKFKGKVERFLAPVLLKTSLKKSQEKLQELANEAGRLIKLLHLGAATLHPDTTSQKRTITAASDLSSPLFGRDKECKYLIDMLINEPCYDGHSNGIREENIPVLVVQGAGGTGKTAVAQGVIKDPRVRGHFDKTIWVHVSRIFDVPRITREIIESVGKGKERCSDIGNPGALKAKLEELLNLNKFFLVLDDVWCKDSREWDRLLGYLNKNGKVGSRILITTQVEEVALILGTRSVIPLKELRTKDCRSILKHYAFGDSEKIIDDQELANIAEEIVCKLKNSPLAARMVGSLLGKQVNVEAWKAVLRQDLLRSAMDALLLSFKHLPSHLQRCFAFCGLYPKGYEFDKDELIRLWIAEGFIEVPRRDDSTPEEKGRDYLDELVSHSFFERKYSGYYRVHDLLHHLAEEVSKDQCLRIENDGVRIPSSIIHLSIAGGSHEVHIPDITHLANLRTFIIFSSSSINFSNEDTKKMFKKLAKLRVLHFPSAGYYSVQELISTICQSKLLRYLHVSGVDELPESLVTLYHLQYLLLPKNLINNVRERFSDLAKSCCLLPIRSMHSQNTAAQVILINITLSPIIIALGNKVATCFGDDATSKEIQILQDIILPKIQMVIKAAKMIPIDKLNPWLMGLKAAAFEAEDMLDLYEYECFKNRVSTHPKPLKKLKVKSKVFFAFMLPKTALRNSFEKLQQFADKAERLVSFTDIDRKTSPSTPSQQTVNAILAPPVFVRDEEHNNLVNMLINVPHDESSCSRMIIPILAVHGIGGVGKTAIARGVFNDPRVECHFDLRMWIYVSSNFDVHRITREIIEFDEQGRDRRLHIGHLGELQMKLKEILKSKKFLLVLDDVWCEDRGKWDELLFPLNEVGNVGRRILITTRKEGVALTLGIGKKNIVPLRELKHEDCWSIFKYYAFGDANKEIENPELAEIGEKIVYKLKNSPVDLSLAGRKLRNKVDVSEWEKVLEEGMVGLMLDYLLLMIQNLPLHLQCCFSFCSLYPKGYAFDKDELVQLWIAEGFVEVPGGNDLKALEKAMEEGRQYFDLLLSYSFFQNHPIVKYTYVIPDLLHDLAESGSQGHCFRIEANGPVSIPATVVHLSIVGKAAVPLSDILELVNLRTLMYIGHGFDNTLLDVTTNKMLKVLTKLRVLYFGDHVVVKLHSSRAQLKHLRYLKARTVTESLRRLYHLQFLLPPDQGSERVHTEMPQGASD